jgi:hypothetical protein
VVANYNHMHALTVQYYEVVQIYRVVTGLHAFRRVLFIPFTLFDFARANADDVVARFRAPLLLSALTQRVRSLLLDMAGSIEVRSGVRVDLPITGPLVAGRPGTTSRVATSLSNVQLAGAETATPAGETQSVPPQPARKIVRAGPIVEILPGDAVLSSLSFENVAVDRVRVDRDGIAAADATFK